MAQRKDVTVSVRRFLWFCPECRTKYTDASVGQWVQCDKCGFKYFVRSPRTAGPAAATQQRIETVIATLKGHRSRLAFDHKYRDPVFLDQIFKEYITELGRLV